MSETDNNKPDAEQSDSPDSSSEQEAHQTEDISEAAAEVAADNELDESESEQMLSEDAAPEEMVSEEAVTEKPMHELDSEDETPPASDENNNEAAGGNSDQASEEEGDEDAPREPVNIPNLPQIIEGAILAADKPLSIDHIIQLFPDGEPSRVMVREAIAEIQQHCEGRGYELKEVASGYRFQVRQAYGDWIGRLWDERPPRYTRALLETLALIAYKQPITRGDIEDIRGVAVSTNIIRTLLEREWIRVVGHRDVPGRPSIYATTKTFLDYFDLTSLDELPTLSEIKDLDKMNEELDLGGELIEPRSLSLESASDEVDATLADDESLDEVTDRVNAIQENIKNLFREPEEELDDDLDYDGNDDLKSEQVALESDEAAVETDDLSAVGSEEVIDETAGDEDDAAAELDDESLEETEAEEGDSPESDSPQNNSPEDKPTH